MALKQHLRKGHDSFAKIITTALANPNNFETFHVLHIISMRCFFSWSALLSQNFLPTERWSCAYAHLCISFLALATHCQRSFVTSEFKPCSIALYNQTLSGGESAYIYMYMSYMYPVRICAPTAPTP